MPCDHYITVVRPVLEYACPVWHSSLTAAQTKTHESLQQRAMKIIFAAVKDYTLSLIFANVDTLESWRPAYITCCRTHKRDSVITDRLRHPKTFKSLLMKTEISHFICTISNIMISTAVAELMPDFQWFEGIH